VSLRGRLFHAATAARTNERRPYIVPVDTDYRGTYSWPRQAERRCWRHGTTLTWPAEQILRCKSV